MQLRVRSEPFSVCQIKDLGALNLQDDFFFLGKTDEELSLVCFTSSVPAGVKKREDGWVCFKIEGVLDFSLVGILAKIAGILAAAQISIFAISTFNTDYLLLKEQEKNRASLLLQEQGYLVS